MLSPIIHQTKVAHQLINAYIRRASSFTTVGNNVPVRLRFAPSPTGLLHLGGFRTALVNYLFAIKHEGKFILRIEDTDQSRVVPGAVEMIQEDLEWLGICPDEGPSCDGGKFGPYTQSQRLSLYEESIKRLLESGDAYECFCSETRLDLIRRDAIKLRQVPRYDNKCRDLTREQVMAKKAAGDKHCIRFKLQPEHVKLEDMVHGTVEFDLTERNYEGDPVIIKTDGFPTYHFANVVDDHYMEISHVLRGIEWQISTPKHLQMYRAFGWPAPNFAHLPNVMNKDGTKLSKRQGDVSMKHYRDMTYYPRALVNFVTKSGGGFMDHSVDKVYSHQELANLFVISRVSTAGCKLDFDLLSKLNQVELCNQIEEDLDSVVSSLILQLSKISDPELFPKSYLEKIIKWCPMRISKISDLVSSEFSYLWSLPGVHSSSNIQLSPQLLLTFISQLESYLDNNSGLLKENPAEVSNFIKDYATANKLKFKVLMSDLRLLLCGLEKGPPIVDLITLFGTKDAIERLRDGLQQNSPVKNCSKYFQIK